MENKTLTTWSFMLVLFFMACQVSAQNPPILKNPKTGAAIKLGPVPVAVNPVRNPNGAPMASKSFNLQNGGIRTINLYKAPLGKPFVLNTGNVVNVQDNDPTITCTNMPVNAESANFEMANFAPTDFIFPGSVVDGMTIPSGEYRQIAAARNPMAIAISLTNGGAAPVSEVVNTPNIASVREAVNRLTAQANFSQGVEVGDDRTDIVFSSEDVALTLDIHAQSLMGSIATSVNYAMEGNKITIVKTIKQRYYSVDVVPPANPQDFFVDPNTAISPNWTYISSVKYGRIGILVMTFESKSQRFDFELATKIRGLVGSASSTIDAETASKIKTIFINGFQFGGPPMNLGVNPTGTNVATAQEIMQRFNNWARKPVNNPQPIAYSLRFVQYENGGPAIASLQSTLRYNARRCVALRPRYEVTLKEIKCIRADDGDGGPGEDIYCMLTSKAYTGTGDRRVNALYNQPDVVLNLQDCATRSINTGGSYPVPNGVRYYDIPDIDSEFRVTIGGDIDEDDNCGIGVGTDDEYGDEGGANTQKTIKFSTIGTNLTTVLFDHKSGNSHIQQVWTLRKVYQ